MFEFTETSFMTFTMIVIISGVTALFNNHIIVDFMLFATFIAIYMYGQAICNVQPSTIPSPPLYRLDDVYQNQDPEPENGVTDSSGNI